MNDDRSLSPKGGREFEGETTTTRSRQCDKRDVSYETGRDVPNKDFKYVHSISLRRGIGVVSTYGEEWEDVRFYTQRALETG